MAAYAEVIAARKEDPPTDDPFQLGLLLETVDAGLEWSRRVRDAVRDGGADRLDTAGPASDAPSDGIKTIAVDAERLFGGLLIRLSNPQMTPKGTPADEMERLGERVGVVRDALALAMDRPRPTLASLPLPAAARGADAGEASNPLLSEPSIHPDLKALDHAMVMVMVWSDACKGSYAKMLALRAERGLPKAAEWPASPAPTPHALPESQWTRLMRQWSGEYGLWCGALAVAMEAAKSPAVGGMMDGAEERREDRWTTRTIMELQSLAGTMHPVNVGADGLGLVRHGLPRLPADFSAKMEAVGKRRDQLRAIPISAVATPVNPPTVFVSRGVILPKTERALRTMLSGSVRDQSVVAALQQGDSYRKIAKDLRIGRGTVGRIAQAKGFTGNAPDAVPLDGTLEENLTIRGRPRNRGAK